MLDAVSPEVSLKIGLGLKLCRALETLQGSDVFRGGAAAAARLQVSQDLVSVDEALAAHGTFLSQTLRILGN